MQSVTQVNTCEPLQLDRLRGKTALVPERNGALVHGGVSFQYYWWCGV